MGIKRQEFCRHCLTWIKSLMVFGEPRIEEAHRSCDACGRYLILTIKEGPLSLEEAATLAAQRR